MMTIDPSARHENPFGEAYGSASRQAAQLASMAVGAHEIIMRRKARRAAMKAASDEQQREAIREQERAAREAARARWAPALDPRFPARADLLTAGRAWGGAAPYADIPEAASALRRAEERMRVLHPYAMDRYDRLRSEGAAPLEAMREAAPLFAMAPYARPGQPGASRPAVTAGVPGAGTQPVPRAASAPRSSFRTDADQAMYQQGLRWAEQLQARALAERGARLRSDELFTELEVRTTLPVDVITGLARTRGEENTAARAARARADGQNLAAAVSAGQPDGGQAEAPGSAAAGAPAADSVPGSPAGERVPLDRSAVRLAAENFPSTAAEGIRAAARNGDLRRPAASQSRTAAKAITSRPPALPVRQLLPGGSRHERTRAKPLVLVPVDRRARRAVLPAHHHRLDSQR